MGKRKKLLRKKVNRKKISLAKEVPYPEAECVWKIIRSHEAVEKVELPRALGSGGFEIRFDMNVSLPSQAIGKGITATGVKARELVTLFFPPTYPSHAPIILLRPDFNSSLPHINPIFKLNGVEYINPCVYDGSLTDLLHQEGDGLSEILNQLSDWLGKAAINDLIDPKQGWEPIRRDDAFGWIVYDISGLRSLVHDKEGFSIFQCKYTRWTSSDKNMHFVTGIDQNETKNITPWLLKHSYYEDNNVFGHFWGSLAILAWAKNSPETIVGKYLPEDVRTLQQLLDRARNYGCEDSLRSALLDICWAFKQANLNRPQFSLFVILCARRPFHLIGDSSSLELIPYKIECVIDNNPSDLPQEAVKIRTDSSVFPLGHRHAVRAPLLRRMSGSEENLEKGHIVFVGCGSVGSKIAMHLARAGQGPFSLIDSSAFSPHNAARHALTCLPEIPGPPKSFLLAQEISLLNQGATPFIGDIIEICGNPETELSAIPKDTRLIIESTGSLAVRETLASLPMNRFTGRLFHAGLYEHGRIGLIAIEGPSHNPNVNDLVAKFWDERIKNYELKSRFFQGNDGLSRQETGLGCGSYTMVMPDTRLSLFAAGMAERAREILDYGAPSIGELWIGLIYEKGMGVSWRLVNLGPTKTLKIKSKYIWEVRLLKNAWDQIEKEAPKWGEFETGGVLIGRISLARRCITVVRVLNAPPDSRRSERAFMLGVEGLKRRVQEIVEKSRGTLSYVGSWHSHPRGGGASTIDKACIQRIRMFRFGAPSVGLIWTPSGFHGIMDEGKLE